MSDELKFKKQFALFFLRFFYFCSLNTEGVLLQNSSSATIRIAELQFRPHPRRQFVNGTGVLRYTKLTAYDYQKQLDIIRN